MNASNSETKKTDSLLTSDLTQPRFALAVDYALRKLRTVWDLDLSPVSCETDGGDGPLGHAGLEIVVEAWTDPWKKGGRAKAIRHTLTYFIPIRDLEDGSAVDGFAGVPESVDAFGRMTLRLAWILLDGYRCAVEMTQNVSRLNAGWRSRIAKHDVSFG